VRIGCSLLCKRAKLRRSPKALVTKEIKEILSLAQLMTWGKVISLEILVIEMGNRGSKSVLSKLLLSLVIRFIVKEQRVDGSSIFIIIVRCTLVAGKSGSLEKLSNQRLKISQ
jgi:hypothetical protein